jgi:hypothetical protein
MKGCGRQQGTLSGTLRRELRVVLSKDRLHLPLRIAKLIFCLRSSRAGSTARGGSGRG